MTKSVASCFLTKSLPLKILQSEIYAICHSSCYLCYVYKIKKYDICLKFQGVLTKVSTSSHSQCHTQTPLPFPSVGQNTVSEYSFFLISEYKCS